MKNRTEQEAQELAYSFSDDNVYPIRYEITHIDGQIDCYAKGLTKRELFSAMAMQGMLANGADKHQTHQNSIYAVQSADALLLELNKGKEDSHE